VALYCSGSVFGRRQHDGVNDAQRNALLATLPKHHVLFFEGQALQAA